MNEQKKERILICGGAGYIGGCLTDLLMQKKYNVTVYDSLIYETRFMKNVSFIFGDIRDKEKLSKIINDFDIIIWLAALVGDGACVQNPIVTTDINLTSLQWLVRNYKGKIIFASTCSVYGINNDVLDEYAPMNPLSHYAETKVIAEKEIIENNDNYLIFRLGTLYGIGDRYSRLRLDLVVNVLTKRATVGEILNVFGGGQWRPLLHVKDVARAMAFSIENKINGLFNLSDKNYKICDIAEDIKKVIPDSKLNFENINFEDLRNYKVSSEKFKSLGWRPKYTLEYGIREIYNAIKDARIKDPNHPVYSNVDYIKKRII
ncbi:NAD(P)-dependent oxidoreductase [Candidatus Parcubacteria bacterium]|nr:NAD(P)-dependent oxidoreductase [Candidatus Parcubacteria bacterium]